MTRQYDISARILKWYKRHGRDLPWRATKNPYHIWISEVMLQQTQVETVIPYYQRFLTRFPTVETLAAASLQDVLKAWENLGYYARARHLHSAAKGIMARTGGTIPANEKELLRLPGIGAYTAAAILSIAFGQRVPAVDGNVRRVLCRLFGIRDPLEEIKTLRHIHELASDLVPVKSSSRFNQGLMDLGATICTPRKPSCGLCPVQESCLAFDLGLQDVLPVTRKRGALPHRQMTAGVLYDDLGRLLIVRRSLRGLLGGLWKFPGGEKGRGQSLKNSLVQEVHKELGIRVRVGEKITTVKHAYTHFRITLHAFRCSMKTGEPRAKKCHSWQWIDPKNLADVPFSNVDRKIMACL